MEFSGETGNVAFRSADLWKHSSPSHQNTSNPQTRNMSRILVSPAQSRLPKESVKEAHYSTTPPHPNGIVFPDCSPQQLHNTVHFKLFSKSIRYLDYFQVAIVIFKYVSKHLWELV